MGVSGEHAWGRGGGAAAEGPRLGGADSGGRERTRAAEQGGEGPEPRGPGRQALTSGDCYLLEGVKETGVADGGERDAVLQALGSRRSGVQSEVRAAPG